MGLKKKIALVAGGVFLVALLAAGGVFIWYKNDLSPWARVLASKDFNVIALNYSIAPEKHYPLPVTQAAILTAPSLCEHFCGHTPAKRITKMPTKLNTPQFRST